MPGLPYSKAEVVYAVRSEMARTVDDVLSRRTRARLLARDASAAAAPEVAALMAAELGWGDAERERQVERYRALIEHRAHHGRAARDRARRAHATTVVVSPRLCSLRSMETNRGAPTPPIAFAGDAASVRGRLDNSRVEVGDLLNARARRDRRRRLDATPPRSARPAATGGRSR